MNKVIKAIVLLAALSPLSMTAACVYSSNANRKPSEATDASTDSNDNRGVSATPAGSDPSGSDSNGNRVTGTTPGGSSDTGGTPHSIDPGYFAGGNKAPLLPIHLPINGTIHSNPSGKPGELDTTFGDQGKTVSNTQKQSIGTTSLLLPQDGSIIVGGALFNGTHDVPYLNRYSTEGKIDTSFGNGGTLLPDPGTVASFEINDMITQNGGVLIAAQETKPMHMAVLMRFNGDGSPDAGFTGDGAENLSYKLSGNVPGKLALAKDGSIYVAGHTQISGQLSEMTLSHYDAKGVFDATFGAKGLAAFADASKNLDYIDDALEVLDDGSIIVAGHAEDDSSGDGKGFVIAEFDSHGQLNAKFGENGNGIEIKNFGKGTDGSYVGLAVQGDGKILVVGTIIDSKTSQDIMGVARFTADGKVDATFGANGLATVAAQSQASAGKSVLLEGDRILIGGSTEDKSTKQSDFILARLTSDGQLDASFGQGGVVTTDFGGDDILKGVALQSDGKIVAAGQSRSGTSNSVVLACYLP